MAAGPNVPGGENMKKNTKLKIKVNLSGKVAVVIGGTGSIGQEIAIGLLESGAKVIAASPGKKSISAELRKIIKNNKNISFLPVDVLSEKSIKNLLDKVLAKFGKADILVLVQGVQLRKPFSQLTLKEWNKILDVNLTGTFLACKYFAKPMIAQNYGKIIGITSLTSEFGIKNISAYAASKGGMTQFLKSASIELARHNINVNMIAPGRIKTKMTEDLLKNKSLGDANLRCIPMGRFGLPSDIVGAALFLASESADYITGQTIFIDGGWLASGGNPGD
jgi:NAD(P)-dependent dehydrogenase (short-subunit alcohol dehydrogenase family)